MQNYHIYEAVGRGKHSVRPSHPRTVVPCTLAEPYRALPMVSWSGT